MSGTRRIKSTGRISDDRVDSLRGVYSYDILASNIDPKLSRRFLSAITELCHSYLCEEFDRNEKVWEFRNPDQLLTKIRPLLDFNKSRPVSLDQLLRECDYLLGKSVRSGHPRVFSLMSNGIDIVDLAGYWITSTINANMLTYEAGSVFLLMEAAILRSLLQIVGFNPETSDGVFTTGGTMSNLYGVLAARYRACPTLQKKGLTSAGRPLVVFTSSHSHYSIGRAGMVAGLGADNVVNVQTDEKGRMDVVDLERAIERSRRKEKKPILVVATAGTTTLGAIDPIKKIADIAKANKMWLHVDASWGGAALMNEKYRPLLDGIKLANSVTWNFNEMMGLANPCSVFLTSDKTVLHEMNATSAAFMSEKDKQSDTAYDTGDKTIQAERVNDVFRLWLTWRSKGLSGFSVRIDRIFQTAHYAVTELKRREANFVIYLENIQCPNVCFWYVPNCLMDRSDGNHMGKTEARLLHRVAPLIKAKMMHRGNVMIDYQQLDDKPNFFRLVVTTDAVTKEDVKFLLDEIEKIGAVITVNDLHH